MKVTPQDTPDKLWGHLLLDKQFHGDLQGSGKGEMFTAGTSVEGSAGYIARERITGVLHGKNGSFTVLHLGTMQRNNFHLQLVIVPDSATDQLVGLSGTMKITIEPGGKHFYELEYTLPG